MSEKGFEDFIPIKPELETPERVVKGFALGRAAIGVSVPRLDQYGKIFGNPESLSLEMAELEEGELKEQLKQLVMRLLERDGWIGEAP